MFCDCESSIFIIKAVSGGDPGAVTWLQHCGHVLGVEALLFLYLAHCLGWDFSEVKLWVYWGVLVWYSRPLTKESPLCPLASLFHNLKLQLSGLAVSVTTEQPHYLSLFNSNQMYCVVHLILGVVVHIASLFCLKNFVIEWCMQCTSAPTTGYVHWLTH